MGGWNAANVQSELLINLFNNRIYEFKVILALCNICLFLTIRNLYVLPLLDKKSLWGATVIDKFIICIPVFGQDL